MYQFIETIRITSGIVHDIEYHQRRVDLTFRTFWPRIRPLGIGKFLNDAPSSDATIKARLLYNGSGLIEKTYSLYTPRPVRALRLVECDDIDYSFKSADRSRFKSLRSGVGADDEIIIVRDGLLTDTSYSNIALFDGSHWVTPARPLLRGTMRQRLLDHHIIKEKDIPAEEYLSYHKVSLINAMLPLGTCVVDLSR